MTAATARMPATAGQLSEDIGDVLASIRRMIAQNEPDRAPQAEGVAQDMPSGSPDLLAMARHASGRAGADLSAPLRLGPSERVEVGGPKGPTSRIPAVPRAAPEVAAEAEAEAEAPAAEADPVPDESAAATDDTAPPATAEDGVLPPADGQEPMPQPMLEPAMTATPTPAAVAVSDEAGTSIFSTMIREMIRQELHGDATGQMARDLRAMVLREVAMAITGQKAGAPQAA